MHDHNLDDLIIDNIEPKNSKTKSFLTIIALSIVVLIVAIILTKILLKTPNDNEGAFTEDTTELIAPELQLKETPESPKEKEAPSLPKIIEDTLNAPAVETKKPVIIEEPTVVIQKEKSELEVKLPVAPQAVETKKEPALSNIMDQEVKAPVPEIKKPVIVQKPSPTLAEIEAQKAKDAADIAYWEAMQEKRKAEQIAREAKAKEVVKEAVKPKTVKATVVKKPVVAKPVPKVVSTGNYYVQVGSFRTKPSSRFISVIKNNGFRYTIKRASDGTKKLLIGPYKDRASVNSALVRVRDRINKSAFIVKR